MLGYQQREAGALYPCLGINSTVDKIVAISDVQIKALNRDQSRRGETASDGFFVEGVRIATHCALCSGILRICHLSNTAMLGSS